MQLEVPLLSVVVTHEKYHVSSPVASEHTPVQTSQNQKCALRECGGVWYHKEHK